MISVLVPTRNRLNNVRTLLDSGLATARTEVEFVFYMDQDDPMLGEISSMIESYYGHHVVYGGPERIVLSQMWNECATVATHDVMMHCGDDIVFRSEGWDERVLEEFETTPDKIILVHGRDGFQDEKLGTHSFIHRNWVNAVGYFVPPYFSSDYNDTWLNDVANALGRRRYVPEIYTEHMHPSAGKGELDQTHRERLERHARDDVDRLYSELAGKREDDVKKLQAFIDVFNI